MAALSHSPGVDSGEIKMADQPTKSPSATSARLLGGSPTRSGVGVVVHYYRPKQQWVLGSGRLRGRIV